VGYLVIAGLSLLWIVLILYSDFQSTRLSLILLLILPFALAGGVPAVVLTGGILSLGSLVGFVTVIGIAARNGIMIATIGAWKPKKGKSSAGT
jgi:Cu/Ag efflux pump CusA